MFSFRKKYLPALICGQLTLLVLGIDQPTKHDILSNQNFESKTIKENEPNFRQSRSVMGITNPVLKALINTAIEVSTSSTKFRKFVKRGSVDDAVADFNKLQPKSLRVSMGTEETRGGFVGDTDVQLHIRKRWATILLYPKDAGAIRISYIEVFDSIQ